jgi:hypothetical protein
VDLIGASVPLVGGFVEADETGRGVGRFVAG